MIPFEKKRKKKNNLGDTEANQDEVNQGHASPYKLEQTDHAILVAVNV